MRHHLTPNLMLSSIRGNRMVPKNTNKKHTKTPAHSLISIQPSYSIYIDLLCKSGAEWTRMESHSPTTHHHCNYDDSNINNNNFNTSSQRLSAKALLGINVSKAEFVPPGSRIPVKRPHQGADQTTATITTSPATKSLSP